MVELKRPAVVFLRQQLPRLSALTVKTARNSGTLNSDSQENEAPKALGIVWQMSSFETILSIVVHSRPCSTILTNRFHITLYNYSDLGCGVEVHQSLLYTSNHGLFTFTDPDSWIVVLLVWLVFTVWVADLGHEVILLGEDVVANTGQVCPLQISVEVDLDDTVANGLTELLLGGAGASVEDEVDRLLL
jgi:hypothetical protein